MDENDYYLIAFKHLLKNSEMTGEIVAAEAGVGQSQISRIKTGKSFGSLDIRRKIAKVFNMSYFDMEMLGYELKHGRLPLKHLPEDVVPKEKYDEKVKECEKKTEQQEMAIETMWEYKKENKALKKEIEKLKKQSQGG